MVYNPFQVFSALLPIVYSSAHDYPYALCGGGSTQCNVVHSFKCPAKHTASKRCPKQCVDGVLYGPCSHPSANVCFQKRVYFKLRPLEVQKALVSTRSNIPGYAEAKAFFSANQDKYIFGYYNGYGSVCTADCVEGAGNTPSYYQGRADSPLFLPYRMGTFYVFPNATELLIDIFCESCVARDTSIPAERKDETFNGGNGFSSSEYKEITEEKRENPKRLKEIDYRELTPLQLIDEKEEEKEQDPFVSSAASNIASSNLFGANMNALPPYLLNLLRTVSSVIPSFGMSTWYPFTAAAASCASASTSSSSCSSSKDTLFVFNDFAGADSLVSSAAASSLIRAATPPCFCDMPDEGVVSRLPPSSPSLRRMFTSALSKPNSHVVLTSSPSPNYPYRLSYGTADPFLPPPSLSLRHRAVAFDRIVFVSSNSFDPVLDKWGNVKNTEYVDWKCVRNWLEYCSSAHTNIYIYLRNGTSVRCKWTGGVRGFYWFKSLSLKHRLTSFLLMEEKMFPDEQDEEIDDEANADDASGNDKKRSAPKAAAAESTEQAAKKTKAKK